MVMMSVVWLAVTLTMVALNEFSRPFRPISQEYLHDLAEGFANLRKLHVKAIVNVYYNNGEPTTLRGCHNVASTDICCLADSLRAQRQLQSARVHAALL